MSRMFDNQPMNLRDFLGSLESFSPEFGTIAQGNIDLKKRPKVKNKDGSISTVRSMSFNQDGQEVLIPTVVGNQVVEPRQAIQHYLQTGEHLGKFTDPFFADKYAQKLHEEQAKFYGL